ncbi:DUF551 domain-containing protein [Klebsiella pneumoniae]|nr:DUF551 domain-containing protein [Klebsiella pneumoniae]HED3414898.1 DUF551 domain-containing protein [Klebsiella michiganensis]MCH0591293.1 DUF551 domain-containing protein [Klebsiella pneumoniae]MCH0596994.1 DUF551 domain-containing protein [Klebsiella pneumoniae]MCH0620241.1 DUF551 domain-containing protein [Klebsiella pneumoniae]
MTSKLTRDELNEVVSTYGKSHIAHRMAVELLAAMDSEPVAEVYQAPNVGICAALGPSIRMLCPLEPGTKLYRHAQPALVIPDEMTSERAHEIGYYYGDPVDVFARGANWMRQHIIDSTLAAAPQSPGSEPSAVPGKWIPVSERMPEPGILVLVYTPPQPGDYPGDVRIGFDYIDPDGDDPTYWFNHGENYEHFCCVACDGMTGPSEKALYTHWMPLPAAPQEVR